MKYLLLAHLAATLFTVGMIRFVQVLRYPLFEKVGTKKKFALYSEAHSRLTGNSVGPPMLVEARTALFLAFRRPEDMPLAFTTLLQVTRHTVLGSGFDEGACNALVLFN